MSRKATTWAYGPSVLDLKLSASELAILRAICWSIDPKLGRTRPLSQKTLAYLTKVTSPTTQDRAIAHLTRLGLLARIHANKLPQKADEAPLRTTVYVYAIPKQRLVPTPA